MTITDEITAWQTGRDDCLAREATEGGGARWGDEIQSFDDEATRILALAAPLIAAAEHLMDQDLDMWAMNATSFTCTESEAIAALIAAAHNEQTAEDFLAAHATGDDEGDDHWALNPDSQTGEVAL